MAKSMKSASNTVLAEKLTEAAEKANQESKVVPIFTPMQTAGKFADETHLTKDMRPKFLDLYDELLTELATEGSSRVAVGNTLIKLRDLFDNSSVWARFLGDCVVKTLRKALRTCYAYIAIADAFNVTFYSNKVVRAALLR